MKILVLQLKRIGDLVLTAPALAALRSKYPEAQIDLAVSDGAAGLTPAFPMIDRTWVFKKKQGNLGLWLELLGSRFDLTLDFTGTDRSALLTVLSKARRRVGFEWMRKSRVRALAYNEFVNSAVREHHTVDHYLELVGFGCADAAPSSAQDESLRLPADALAAASALVGSREFIQIHPGTARVEKYWVAERWAEVIDQMRERHGLECVITGGVDAFEREHIAQIQGCLGVKCLDLSGKMDLLTFAAVIAKARLCLSCDTAAVHLAAAFQKPQIALFGLTNPFHWRPRHPKAIVLSAAHPEGELLAFGPRMKGAPMEAIGSELVLQAAERLLAPSASAL